MAADPIRVGVIGANPDRGWAARAHVPALRALPDYELTAVATSHTDSAREAARDVEVHHVARLYAMLATDLRTGTRTAPSFEDGLRLHRLLDTIRRSAATGTRQPVHR